MLVEVNKINKVEVATVTSLDVAETFGKEHFHVIRDIKTLGCSEEFNASNYGCITYKDSKNRNQPAYIMTKNGFTLLVMGYTGEKAMKFKEAYINQFDAMAKLLEEKKIEREKGIVLRQTFTKTIQLSKENERMHGHAYSTFTNVIYKTLFNKNAKQMREYLGIGPKDSIRDALSVDELKALESMEHLAASLVEYGYGYDEVKERIQEANARRISME